MAVVTKPHIGTDVKEDFVAKVLSRLKLIAKSKKAFEKDESVLGIFKTTGFTIDHFIITNYRIFGVKILKAHNNPVFDKELTDRDMQSVTVKVKNELFNQKLYYDIEIESGGKKSKYATVKKADADNVSKLFEKIKSSDTLTSLLEAQGQLENEEDAERKAEREKNLEARRAQLNDMKQRRQEEAQAKKDANQAAKEALQEARGRLLGQADLAYVGGYDSGRHSGALYFYEGRLEYRAIWSDPNIIVEAEDIAGVSISGRQETKTRLTATRLVTLGVFALAAPKRTSVKEANVTVSLKDGRQVLFHTNTLTEYEVHKKLIDGISYYSQIQANDDQTQTPSPVSAGPDSADLLAKYADLHKKGVLTDEEFQAKKKQLLGL